MKKLSLDQTLVIVAAVVFLLGAVVMLVNVFLGQSWAFWVSLCMVFVASALVMTGLSVARKKDTQKSS